jgi:hypothetical protein
MLDILWKLTFISVVAAVLAASLGERPTPPLCIWLASNVLQCPLHVFCVVVTYWLKASRPLIRVLVINDNHYGLTFLFES